MPDALVISLKRSGPNWRKTRTSLVLPVTAIKSSCPVKSRSISVPSIPFRLLSPLSAETSVTSPFVDVQIRSKPVVQSQRILPVALGVPLLLAVLLLLSLARRRRRY